MQIEWITVTAQIANFLVLAWLLHRFLYGPITHAMERREQRIAQRLNDAEKKRKEAETEAHTLRTQQEELAAQRAALLEKAETEAEAERRRLQQEARGEIEAQKRAWTAEMKQQQAEFLQDIRQRALDHFDRLARRALGDLADAALEEQIGRVFLKKLAALDGESKRRIADAGRKAGHRAAIRSAFEMPPALRRDIAKAIQAEILADAVVTFERDPGALCGVSLKMGGQTVTWSVDGYFETLEKLIAQDLGDRAPFPDGTDPA